MRRSPPRGGIHVYEGPPDPNFPNAPTQPGDLLNAGRASNPPPTVRQLISDFDVKVLVDAFGFDAVLPSQVNTFHVALDRNSGSLFVVGDTGSSNDDITISRSGDEFVVRVNETSEAVSADEVTSISILAGNGNDTITVDYGGGDVVPTGGLTIDAGSHLPNGEDVLQIEGTADSIEIRSDNATNGSVTVDGSVVRFANTERIDDNIRAETRRIEYDVQNDVIVLEDDATPSDGSSRIQSSGTSPRIDFRHPSASLVIQPSGGNNTIRLLPLDTQSEIQVTVLENLGTNAIELQGGSLHETVLGSGEVFLGDSDVLSGFGAITGTLTAASGSRIEATDDLRVSRLANDGTLVLVGDAELSVVDLDNAGGILQASPQSTTIVTGSLSTGGLGEDKRFGNLVFSGAAAEVRGPVDAQGVIRLANNAQVNLTGTLIAGGLATEAATQLDNAGIETLIRGNVSLAPATWVGDGPLRVVGPGILDSRDNSIFELQIEHSGTTQVTSQLRIGDGGLLLESGMLSVEDSARIEGRVDVGPTATFSNPPDSPNHQFTFHDSIQIDTGGLFEIAGPGGQVTFEPGTEVSVVLGGLLVFAGAESSRLSLRSSSPGNPWSIMAPETDDVGIRFVDIQDADASSVPEPLFAVKSIDSGNNSNFLFVDAETVIALTADGDLLIKDVAAKADELIISTSGNNLVIEDAENDLETNVGTNVSDHRASIPMASVPGQLLIIEPKGGNDTVTVRPLSGDLIDFQVQVIDKRAIDEDQLIVDLSEGGQVSSVSLTGGGGDNDTLKVVGDTDSAIEYSPGQVTFNQTPVTFEEVSTTFLSNVQTATFVAPDAENTIRVQRPEDDQVVVSGSSDGTPFTSFTFDDIDNISFFNVEGNDGADHLIVDHTSGLDPILGRGITFTAGTQPDGQEDVLEILEGTFNRVVYDYDSASDGSVDLSGRSVRFTGVEPIINSGVAGILIFDLTSEPDEATLEDLGNGQLRLRSGTESFQSTSFLVPETRITVFGRDGNDLIAADDLTASTFDGELFLNGQNGDDLFMLAPIQGVDVDVSGNAGENRLSGMNRGPLVFSGGSNTELEDVFVQDIGDGEAAFQIRDENTSVFLSNVQVIGNEDDLFLLENGIGNAPPTLSLISSNNTFRIDDAVGDVAFVDNQTSPTEAVELTLSDLELGVAQNGSRTVRLASDDRSVIGISGTGNAHGLVVNNGDGTITYTPDANYTGPARFSYQLEGGASASVDIDVLVPNQPPVNTVPPAQTIAEDSALVFSASNGKQISINDPDAQDDVVMVELSVDHGQLSVMRAGRTQIDGNGTSSVALVGRIDNLNATLNGLVYQPALHFDENETLTIVTNDLGNNGSGGARTDVDSVAIRINAVNDAPVNSVPEEQSADEDMALMFSDANGNALSVHDPDAKELGVETTLRVSQGTLTVIAANDASVTGNGSDRVVLSGEVDDVNELLQGLTYQGELHFNGTDTLTITTDDQGNQGGGGPFVATDGIPIAVRAINDRPENSVPGAQAIDEDQEIRFDAQGGNAISVSDVDAGPDGLEVTASADHGILFLATTDNLSSVAGDGTSVVTISGSITSINVAMDGLLYRPKDDYFGQDLISLRSNDRGNTGFGGPQVEVSTIDVQIGAINDAPVNNVPSSQSIDEDSPLVFSTENGNPVTISDVDAGSRDLQVRLAVNSGMLALARTDGLTSVSGDNSPSITLLGSPELISEALDGLTYTPSPDFHGQDLLSIDTSDRALDGALSDNDTVPITVRSLNDGPRITFAAATVRIIQDAGPQTVTDFTTVEVGPQDEIDDGQNITSFAVTGNDNPDLFVQQPEISANGTLTFTSAPDRFGLASVTVTARDDGGTAGGGQDTTITQFEIEILSDNIPPIAVGSIDDVTVDEDAASAVIELGAGGSQYFQDADGEPLTILVNSENPQLVAATITNDQLILDFQQDATGVTSVHLTASDAEQASATISFNVAVNAINDAPANVLPGLQIIDPDSTLTFSEETNNAISILDVDSGLGGLRVTVEVTQGTLTIGEADAANVSSDGTSTVTIEGPRLGINDALDGMVYQPPSQFSGLVTLTVTTNDQGHSGGGGPMVELDTMAISVRGENRPPTIDSNPAFTVIENTTNVGTVRANDPNGDPLTFRISGGADQQSFVIDSNSGVLTFVAPPDFENPADNNSDNQYEVEITVDDGLGGSASQDVVVSVSDLNEDVFSALVVDVTPDPRAGAVEEILILFTRQVSGFDLTDLSLSRTTNSTVDVPLAAATLTTSDNVAWTLAGLNSLTGASGNYVLTLNAVGSGIQDSAGTNLTTSPTEEWTNGAGDANEDRKFDPVDLVVILQAGKYLTGQPALWREGDWNLDGQFNPLDIILAQLTEPPHYLQGPFAARRPQSSVIPDGSDDLTKSARVSSGDVRANSEVDVVFDEWGQLPD